MKSHHLIPFALIILIAITGCGDDNGSTGPDINVNGLAVVLERTGEEDIEISEGSFADADIQTTRFCYAEEGCEGGGGGSNQSWSGPSRYSMEHSDPGKEAVGVIVEFEVISGEGFVEIVEGEAYENENGFPQFDEENVVETSDAFSEGDVIQLSYGDTD